MKPSEFRTARRELGLSQSEFAALVGVMSDRTVRRWEDGEREIPGPVILLISMFTKSREAFELARHVREKLNKA